MSEMVRHVGKLREIILENESISDWIEGMCTALCVKDNGDGLLDALNEFYYDRGENHCYKYIIIDGRLFELINDKKEDYENDIEFLSPNSDGTYDYVMQYYNGGACLSDMIEGAIREQIIYNKRNRL